MTQNLFAACRRDDTLVAKRVKLNESTRRDIESIFAKQESEFVDGVVNEVPFDGNWTPDSDEFLTIDIPAEAKIFQTALTVNLPSIPAVNPGKFLDEKIKALFTGVPIAGGHRILVQGFTPRQMLNRKFALMFDGDTFNRVTTPAFTLDTSLTCIIEGGKIKFKSFHKLRSIIDLSAIYREATNEEVREFAGHAKIAVDDSDTFVDTADQQIRKLIHSIANEGLLSFHTAKDIQDAAKETKLPIEVRNGKIVMPTERREIKELLRFLNEARYAGPISRRPYITNSRRLVQ